MSIRSKANAEHYQWGQACDGWRLLEGGDLSVIHERMPPGTNETRHYHRAARQFFFVLQGEAELELGGRVHRLLARHGLEVPPGQAHEMRNTSYWPVEFLVISSPSTQGDRSEA
jgi:mannose-6-phosphate isomerase-like protein (cupin superfamily)